MSPQSLFSRIVRPEKLLIKLMVITLRVQHSLHVGISLVVSSALTMKRNGGYVLDALLVVLPTCLGSKTNSPF